MEKLQQLFAFLFSFNGMLICTAGICLGAYGLRHQAGRWALFGIAMFTASLTKYFNAWEMKSGDPHWGVIESLTVNGRPVTMVVLAVLVAIVFIRPGSSGRKISPLLVPIHGIQALILMKLIVSGGDMGHIIQAAFIYVFLGILAAQGLRGWLAETDSLAYCAIALYSALIIFVIIGEWEVRTNTSAVMIGNRFMGTTANPQHAAVFLAIGILGPAYFLVRHNSFPQWMIPINLVTVLATVHLLLLTGSRTGLVLAVIGIAIFLRRRFATGILLCGFAAITAYLLKDLFLSQDTGDFGRVLATNDTRTAVWSAQWEGFLRYPVFGRPYIGPQFQTAENSWLGLMEGTGSFGLALLLLLSFQLAENGTVLFRLAKKPFRSEDVDFCLAGPFAVFSGSFLEGYLLGVITMPVMFIAMLSVACESVIRDCKQHEILVSRENFRRRRTATGIESRA